MSTRIQHRFAALCGILATTLGLASCSNDVPTAVQPARVAEDRISDDRSAVCHRSGGAGQLIEGTPAEMESHRRHGDYQTNLVVTHDADRFEDGRHFRRITDALAAARAGRLARGEFREAACRITITVAAGVFRGTGDSSSSRWLERFPLIVDVPDITLRGALVMQLDAHGRATGQGLNGVETTLVPIHPLPSTDEATTPLILANGHPGGSAGNGLTVEGFVFKAGRGPEDEGGEAVFALRVTGLTIRSNRIEGGFLQSVDLRATSADIERNQLSGTVGTCDMCLAGPGAFRVVDNQLLAGGVPGITTSPVVGLGVLDGVEPYTLPATALTTVEIGNNEVRDHLRIPTGTGLRLEAVGIFAPDVHGTIRASIHDNLLVNNRFGMIFHAAFPAPDTRLRGDLDVTLSGNVIQQSCQTKLLVAFTRHKTAFGLENDPYLRNSTYRVRLGGDIEWSDAWFSNPVGFGNTLVVDGHTIPNGTRQFYSEETCPGLAAAP